MLTVWGRADSSNVQAVMWCVAELGLDYTRHDVGHRYGGTDTAEYLAMNPNGTVPTLRDGSNPPLWESAAIVRYLANVYGSSPFWPDDPVARTNVDRWGEWSKVNVALQFTGAVFWKFTRTAPKDRDPKAIAQAMDALEAKLAIAEAQLKQHAFLAGDDFTLADIMLGHTLFRYFTIEVTRADLPALAAYYARLQERAPFREHVMVSYDALKVTD